MKKLALIGVGKMGSQVLKTLQKSHCAISAVDKNPNVKKSFPSRRDDYPKYAIGIDNPPNPSITFLPSIQNLRGKYDSIFLAVKPNEIINVSQEIQKAELKNSLNSSTIVSCLAGVQTDTLKQLFPDKNIVRIMPNLTIGQGKGLTSVLGKENPFSQIRTLFTSGGVIHKSSSDDDIDSVTCLAASGPVYFLKTAEIMISEGIEMGLSEKESRILVNSALMSAVLSCDNTQTINNIASPGGITERALTTLDQHNFSESIRSAIRQSWCRAKNLDSNVRYQITSAKKEA